MELNSVKLKNSEKMFDKEYFELVKKTTWENLKTSCGTAEHIPKAIYDICNSSDINKRDEAYGEIDNYVVLQRDLFESAYWVIDLILYCLERNDCFGDEELLSLLIEISHGNAHKDSLIVIENGETMPLVEACRKKIYGLKERISRIKLEKELEEEKQILVDYIEDEFK